MNAIRAALIAMFKALGIDVDAKKAEIDEALKPIETEIEKLSAPAQNDPPKPGAPPSNDAVARAVAEALAPMNAKFDALSGVLDNEKKARETATTALESERKEQLKKEREKIVDEAIEKGKLTKEQRDPWLARFEQAHELSKQILDELPPNPAVNRQQQKPNEKSDTTTSGTNTGQQDYRSVQQAALSLLQPADKN